MEFGSKFDIRKDKQYLVAYTEENHPNVYSTAFCILDIFRIRKEYEFNIVFYDYFQ